MSFLKTFILFFILLNISHTFAQDEFVSKSQKSLKNIVQFSAPVYSGNCNGIIIHPKLILTTAYCANNVKIGTNSKVIWPTYDSSFSKLQRKKYVYNILYTSTHPKYNSQLIDNITEKSTNTSLDLGYLILDREIPIKQQDIIPFLAKEHIEEILYEGFSPKLIGYFYERKLPSLFETTLNFKSSNESLSHLFFDRIPKLNSFSAPIILNLSIGRRILALRARSLIKDHMHFIVPSFGEEWLKKDIGYDKDDNFSTINTKLICKFYMKEEFNINKDNRYLNVLKSLVIKFKNGAIYENLPGCLPDNIIEVASQSIFEEKIKNSYNYKNAIAKGLKKSHLLTAGTLALDKKLALKDYIELRKYKLNHYLSIATAIKFMKGTINRDQYFRLMQKEANHLNALNKLMNNTTTDPNITKEKP